MTALCSGLLMFFTTFVDGVQLTTTKLFFTGQTKPVSFFRKHRQITDRAVCDPTHGVLFLRIFIPPSLHVYLHPPAFDPCLPFKEKGKEKSLCFNTVIYIYIDLYNINIYTRINDTIVGRTLTLCMLIANLECC